MQAPYLAPMNADILGIIELENTETTTIANLVDSLNNTVGRETYAYIDTGRIGNDQIRVALIYQLDAVTPAGASMIDSSSIFERPPLAQTRGYHFSKEQKTYDEEAITNTEKAIAVKRECC